MQIRAPPLLLDWYFYDWYWYNQMVWNVHTCNCSACHSSVVYICHWLCHVFMCESRTCYVSTPIYWISYRQIANTESYKCGRLNWRRCCRYNTCRKFMGMPFISNFLHDYRTVSRSESYIQMSTISSQWFVAVAIALQTDHALWTAAVRHLLQ